MRMNDYASLWKGTWISDMQQTVHQWQNKYPLTDTRSIGLSEQF